MYKLSTIYWGQAELVDLFEAKIGLLSQQVRPDPPHCTLRCVISYAILPF